MPYRRVVEIAVQDNGPGVPKAYFYNPGSRSRPFIWFADPDVPEWAKGGGAVEIERTGYKRPAWRIVGPG